MNKKILTISLFFLFLSNSANADYYYRWKIGFSNENPAGGYDTGSGGSGGGGSGGGSSNNPPTCDPFNDTFYNQNVSFTYNLPNCNDIDGDTLTVSSFSLPNGLTVSGNQITGIPTTTGNQTASITISDGKGGDITETFNLSYNNPPYINYVTGGSVRPYNAGKNWFYIIQRSDPDGDTPVTVTPITLNSGITASGAWLEAYPITAGTTGNIVLTVKLKDSRGAEKIETINVPENGTPYFVSTPSPTTFTTYQASSYLYKLPDFVDPEGKTVNYRTPTGINNGTNTGGFMIQQTAMGMFIKANAGTISATSDTTVPLILVDADGGEQLYNIVVPIAH